MSGLASARWEMIEAGGRTAQSFGLNRLMGQIYMSLFLIEEPLNLDEMAEQLGVSKASISISCRQLESWGALKRVWKKGDRKDYYEAETDLGRLLNNGLKTSLLKKLESARIQIERSLELIDENGGTRPNAEFMRRRLKEADAYRERIEKVLGNPIVSRVLRLK
jgi:DNA-binding transcriptional regulator GbsR (MarR family)